MNYNSVCLACIPILGMNWHVVCRSNADPNLRVGIKRIFCLMSVLRWSQHVLRWSLHERWNEKKFVRLRFISTQTLRVKWNIICPSVYLTWMPIRGMKWRVVCPSYEDPNMRCRMKRIWPSVCLTLKGHRHDWGKCLFTKIIWNEILIEFLQKVFIKCTNHFGKDWAMNRAEITHKSLYL